LYVSPNQERSIVDAKHIPFSRPVHELTASLSD
jgi:hypothetical protein